MSFTAIAGSPPQYQASDGSLANGYFLKFYAAGTTTPINMATNASGVTLLDKAEINAAGYPVNGSGDIFVPHVDQSYKIVLYTTAADADSNLTANADWVVDNLQQNASASPTQVLDVEYQLGSAASGQVFTLTAFTYVVGISNLQVYRNGVRLRPGASFDYEETSNTTITVNSAITIGASDVWTFAKGETSTSTAIDALNVSYLPAGTGAQATNVRAKLREFSVTPQDFGAVGDGVTDDTAAIAACLASGAKRIYFPKGTYITDGNHNVPQNCVIFGDGIQSTIIKASSSTVTVFKTEGDGINVTFGGNVIYDLTFDGNDRTGTSIGFLVKTRVRIAFFGVEFTNCAQGVSGSRTPATESVNSVGFFGCRFSQNFNDIYAPRQWNGLYISSDTQFSGASDWSVRVYDADGVTINGVFDGTPTSASTGHVALCGCSGINYGAYHEGTPTADHFVKIASGQDEDGNASVGGIAISDSRGGSITGCRSSSASGVDYLFSIVGARGFLFSGNRAGSGISTALVRLGNGSNGNAFVGNWSNPGTVVSYETAGDADNNFEMQNGSNLFTHLKANEVEIKSKLDITGNPADRSGNLGAFASGDSSHVYYDGGRNNDVAALYLNAFGYQGGATRFRRTFIQDGKGNNVLVSYPDAGRVQSFLPFQLPVYTDGTRPAANTLTAGSSIWNSSDNAPNYSDGTNWRDAAGAVT